MKAYILIRALVKTDAPDGTPVAEQAAVLRDEVHSNLESCGEDVLMVIAGVPPTDALQKLGDNRDTYTLDMAEKIGSGEQLIAPTRGVLRAVLEDRDFWMRRFVDANDEIADWLHKAPLAEVADGTLAQSYRAFVHHHSALMEILGRHALVGPVPRGYLHAATLAANVAAATTPEPESPGKCGNCLMETVDVVALQPDGTCPKCGQNYSKGIPPRPAATTR